MPNRLVTLALACAACIGCAPSPGHSPAPTLGSIGEELALPEVSTGNAVPLRSAIAPAQIFVFVRSDCPIANRYAPEINALTRDYGERGVPLWLVYVDPDEDDALIEKHREEYELEPRALRDDAHALVDASGAKTTPTALVVMPDGRIAYRGRIDARYPGFGKARKGSGRRDLALALEDVLAGRPVEVPETEAVGCFITDLSP